MASVIPKQLKKEREQITIKLEKDVLETLEKYCRYLESSRDYVISQCLVFIFRKDRNFQIWKECKVPAAAAANGKEVKAQAR